jgi:hypothetical protein
MQIKDMIKKLETSKEFKAWRRKHKSEYLVHIFKMVDQANKDSWQVGYYNKAKDQITTCLIDTNIQIVPETEIFRKEKHVIKKLDLSKIKVDFKQALNTAVELQKDKYPNEPPVKIIAILQNLDKQLWNITFVTASFKTLNIKINAQSKYIESDDLASLVDFK